MQPERTMEPTQDRRSQRGQPLAGQAARHGPGDRPGALLCIAATLLNSNFATLDNITNVLSTRTAFIGIIAVGMCFVIVSGGIDLPVGSMAALIAPPSSWRQLASPLIGPWWAPSPWHELALVLGAAFGLAHGL